MYEVQIQQAIHRLADWVRAERRIGFREEDEKEKLVPIRVKTKTT